jgi:hypothetical protein
MKRRAFYPPIDRAFPVHPRLAFAIPLRKSWMPSTGPGTTKYFSPALRRAPKGRTRNDRLRVDIIITQ